MKTLITISWRNIWRHPARSGVMLAAITIGLWSALLIVGWANGLLQQRMDYMIEREVTHAQVHHPEFLADLFPWNYIPNHDDVSAWLKDHPDVASHTSRTITEGMLQSPVKTSGVRIRGIDTQTETRTTRFHENMVEGEYLDTGMRNAVIISRIMADDHNMRIGNRIVLTFENMNGELTSGSFFISGFFESASSDYDRRNIFVRSADLLDLLADQPVSHEIGIMLKDVERADALVAELNDQFEGIHAQTWRELSPELSMIVALGGLMVIILTVIFMIALGFGILNTMLMALFERMREIGMLLSIGMSKLRVFGMIMLEASILTMTGAFAGILLAWLSIMRLGKTGINLEMFADGAAMVGFDYMIYPFMTTTDFVTVIVIVIIITLLASFYPAMKAVRIKPLEAARDS
ncbi:FtsX-like permease family protein [Balneolales bacterium ANBcel1]|nr:FtsX-like permease family protein [Balneolales bacterium ANBcel1]